MGFLADKKAEHEKACEEAIRQGDSAQARFHAMKAAEFSYALAQQSTGAVANGYVSTAEGWLEISEKLKTAKLPKAVSKEGVSSGAGFRRSAVPAEPSASDDEFLVASVPEISFDDIAGMTEAKKTIQEMIVYPMREPEKARALNLRPGGGVILYGPPGNGKTMFGKAIAHEIAAPFFYASGAQLRSKWHGESEQKLSRLLQAAQSHPVAVLFLDEIDGLLPRRTGNSSVVDNRVVTQFLSDVGGFRESENALLILGATNKPWDIDEAVFRTGRFDEKLYIGLPDAPARLGMLERAFKNVAREASLDLSAWAAKLELFSGSDITGLAKKACQIAFRRSIETGSEPLVLATDFEEAVKSIPSSVTPQMLKQYETFNTQRFASK